MKMKMQIGGYEISSLGDADPITRVKDSSGEEDRQIPGEQNEPGKTEFQGPQGLVTSKFPEDVQG